MAEELGVHVGCSSSLVKPISSSFLLRRLVVVFLRGYDV